MIRYTSQKQLSIEGFDTPFEKQLDANNRWVKLGQCIPWDDLAAAYYRNLSAGQGRPSKDARLVIGAVIIKHNRWANCQCIPWDDLAAAYYRNLSAGQGRPSKDARLVIGAVIIKHKLCLSNEETVQQIRENPYLQYFVGLAGYQN